MAPDEFVGRAGKGDGCPAGVVALRGISTAKLRTQCVEGVRGGLGARGLRHEDAQASSNSGLPTSGLRRVSTVQT
jgi:hypothetical protein